MMPLFQTLRRRIFIFQIFLLLIGASLVAYSAQRTFERDLEPDMTQKAVLIAHSLAQQFERALSQGITFSRLRGVNDLFQNLRADNSEILFIATLKLSPNHQEYAAFANGTFRHGKNVSEIGAMLPPPGEIGGSESPLILSWNGALVASHPIFVNGKPFGWVLVGMDANYIQEQLTGLIYDIVVVLAVSLLITFELLLLIMARTGSPELRLQSILHDAQKAINFPGIDPPHAIAGMHGLKERVKLCLHGLRKRSTGDGWTLTKQAPGAAELDESRLETALAALTATGTGEPKHKQREVLIRVRMPLFIFFLSEELSRPFFPIYAKSLASSFAGLPPEVVISFPMIVFMLVVAFSQPLGGPWAERFGARRMMFIGAVIGALGLGLTAFSWNFFSLIAWRFLTAAGYGIMFVAGQSHVIAHTDKDNRAWGMAMFVGSVLGASICGPAIGGILADRIGDRGTFMFGAATAVISALLACWLLPVKKTTQTPGRGGALRLKNISLVLSNPRFVALLIGGAMPAKIILTGFLYYLSPLYLAHLGNGPSATGRIVMLYGLMMVLITPLAARLADRFRRPLIFVITGGIISALGTFGILFSSSTTMLIIAVLILGIAQAISITPQLSLVPVACPDECRQLGQVTVVGFFRLFERIGSALGPLIAAFLLQHIGYQATAVTIGAGVALASVVLGLAWMATSKTRTIASQRLEHA